MINRDHSQDQILGMNALSLYCTCWCGYLSYVKQATCPPTTLNQLRDGTHPLKFVPTRSWWLTMSNQKYGRGYICFAIIVFCCCMIQPSVFVNNSHCLIIWRSIVKYSQLSQLGFLSRVRPNWYVLLASSPSCMRPLKWLHLTLENVKFGLRADHDSISWLMSSFLGSSVFFKFVLNPW
jgi:hypothetical protein